MSADSTRGGEPNRHPHQDPAWLKWPLVCLAVALLTLLVVVPVTFVFTQAFSKGAGAYCARLFGDADTRQAIVLTAIVAPTVVAANVLFGLAAAWLVARFRFRGRALLTALIDLPFAVSPVVAGLSLLLIFGRQGYLGPLLADWGIEIVFATPGLILATCFVTLPFVARELIPLMEAIGPDEEWAALSLGAGPMQMFWRVTVPNIKWGLLYGAILCSARAVGEFGAVYVVSGHIAGQTDTLPLRIDRLFQEYDTAGSFAVASLLTLLALVSLVLKVLLERVALARSDGGRVDDEKGALQ